MTFEEVLAQLVGLPPDIDETDYMAVTAAEDAFDAKIEALGGEDVVRRLPAFVEIAGVRYPVTGIDFSAEGVMISAALV